MKQNYRIPNFLQIKCGCSKESQKNILHWIEIWLTVSETHKCVSIFRPILCFDSDHCLGLPVVRRFHWSEYQRMQGAWASSTCNKCLLGVMTRISTYYIFSVLMFSNRFCVFSLNLMVHSHRLTPTLRPRLVLYFYCFGKIDQCEKYSQSYFNDLFSLGLGQCEHTMR